MARPSLKGLSAAEKAKRWSDHARASAAANNEAAPGVRSQRVEQIKNSHGFSNPYLLNILDPEAHRGEGVPDNFDVSTTKFQSIENVPVEFATDGRFVIVARPYLRSALGHLREAVATGALGVVSTTLVSNNQRYRTVGALEWRDTSAGVNSVGTTAVVDYFTGVGTVTAPRAGFQHDGFTSQLPSPWPARGVFIPIDAALQLAGTTKVQIKASFTKGAGAATALQGSVAFGDNSGALQGGTAFVNLTSDAWVTLTASSNTGVALLYATFRSTGGAATGEYDIHGYDVRVVGPEVADEQIEFDDLDEADTVSSDFHAVRPVGMSLLVTYRGPLLNDGGQIAARYFSGVESHPPLAYEDLAVVPGAYDGPLRHGAYVFWKPAQLPDLEFYPPHRDGASDKGVLVVSGVATDTANAALRARLVINWEAITYSRKFNPTPSVVAPDRLAHAFSVLAGQPTAFENPLHLAKIWSIAKRGATQAADMAWKARGSIGTALAPSLAAVPEVGPALALAARALSRT